MHAVKYYLALTWEKPSQAIAWMNLEDTMLSEIRLSQKRQSPYDSISMSYLEKSDSQRLQNGGCQGPGGKGKWELLFNSLQSFGSGDGQWRCLYNHANVL